MAKNRMKEVAQLLGIELEERFNVKGYVRNPYYLTEKGMYSCDGDNTTNTAFVQLLLGEEEIEKQILTSKEKTYLENVLKPFKNRVEYVEKSTSKECFYINVALINNDCMNFPNFGKDTMYRGMELNKKYSLKELGLFK